MKKKLIFVLSITAILIASCKKNSSNPAAPPAHVTFDAEGLAYVQLPLNRYFIYKDSATGLLDSVVVTKSDLVSVTEPAHLSYPTYIYQTFTLTLTKYNTTPIKDWFYGIANNSTTLGVTDNITSQVSLRERNQVMNTDEVYAFHYPFNNALYLTHVVVVLPTITIEGRTYFNAVLYSDFSGPVSYPIYPKGTYYWVKGVGIIKRVIQTSTSIKTDLLVRSN